jgi:SAM-dependent methyltransferase
MSTMDEAISAFKTVQKQNWPSFASMEMLTMLPAAQLVKRARVRAGQRVLDVGCGTGVVALSAALRGAQVTGLDFTPELLAHARENAQIVNVDVDWIEGDAEALPFPDSSFDAVLSQFGHIFAPRPEVATSEMLRVLKPGGTIAFSTWPPDLFVGRTFKLLSHYLPSPAAVPSPALWGDPTVIEERLGNAVSDLVFDQLTAIAPALSPKHHQFNQERFIGPVTKLVQMLESSDPKRLAAFRAEYEAISADYFEDNAVSLGYLVTRATKR